MAVGKLKMDPSIQHNTILLARMCTDVLFVGFKPLTHDYCDLFLKTNPNIRIGTPDDYTVHKFTSFDLLYICFDEHETMTTLNRLMFRCRLLLNMYNTSTAYIVINSTKDISALWNHALEQKTLSTLAIIPNLQWIGKLLEKRLTPPQNVLHKTRLAIGSVIQNKNKNASFNITKKLSGCYYTIEKLVTIIMSEVVDREEIKRAISEFCNCKRISFYIYDSNNSQICPFDEVIEYIKPDCSITHILFCDFFDNDTVETENIRVFLETHPQNQKYPFIKYEKKIQI